MRETFDCAARPRAVGSTTWRTRGGRAERAFRGTRLTHPPAYPRWAPANEEPGKSNDRLGGFAVAADGQMVPVPLPLLVLIFVAAATFVWLAGVQLSDTTDVLATRLGLGEALGGLLLLAVATNLPEIAITASAALHHDLGIAIGNILGGIAIQTAVLVALDVFGTRGGRPLTYRAASLQLML